MWMQQWKIHNNKHNAEIPDLNRRSSQNLTKQHHIYQGRWKELLPKLNQKKKKKKHKLEIIQNRRKEDNIKNKTKKYELPFFSHSKRWIGLLNFYSKIFKDIK